MIKIEMKPGTKKAALEQRIQAEIGITPKITICSKTRLSMTIDALTEAQTNQLETILADELPGWETKIKATKIKEEI